MPSTRDWEKEIVKLNTEDINRIKDALRTLNEWNFFKNAFENHGLRSVEMILSGVLKDRLIRSHPARCNPLKCPNCKKQMVIRIYFTDIKYYDCDSCGKTYEKELFDTKHKS